MKKIHFIHEYNKRIYSSYVENGLVITKPFKEIYNDEIFFTINGSLYQHIFPELSSILDIRQFSAILNDITVDFSLKEILPHVLANQECGFRPEKYPYFKIKHFYEKIIINKIKQAESIYEKMTKEDIEYCIKYGNSRQYIMKKNNYFKYKNEPKKTYWDKFSTKTGRLKVLKQNEPEDNFDCLKITKIDRENFSTIEENRLMLHCDFRALEFRTILKYFNITELLDVEDPYTEIAQISDLDCKDRSIYKNAIISLMYGSTLKNSELNDNDKAKLFLWMNNNLNFDKIYEESKVFLEKNGFIRNMFGRRIYENDKEFSKSVFVNNLFQSSGADIAIYSYYRLLRAIEHLKIDSRLLFMIHDAIVFDSSYEAAEILIELDKIGRFPVEWQIFNKKNE